MRTRIDSMRMTASAAALLLASLFGVTGALAQDVEPAIMDAGQLDPASIAKFYKKPGYSPYAGRTYPTRVFWGDQHVHTGWSADAGMSGATLTPEDAVRFARGEEVVSNTGQPVKLSRPLDWIAVTDHSDGMGVISELKAGNPELMADPVHEALARHDAGGPGAGRRRDDGADQGAIQQIAAGKRHGPEICEVGLAEEQRDHGEVQRAGTVHHVHRL